MKFNKVFLVITLFFYAHVLFAQTCPEKIDIFEKIEHLPDEWTSKLTEDEHELMYMSVFNGDPEAYPLAILKPEFTQTRPKEIAYWDFRPSVGKENDSPSVGKVEEWMRCHYRGTNLVIQRRINSDVTRCFIRSNRKPQMYAGCVKE